MRIDHKYRTLLNREGINTPLRLAHFLAQIEHESGLKPIEENLRYSASRLMVVFPKYFPTIELAKAYEYKPKEIASRVYGGRMGNGCEQSSDGWKYRGRGFIQLTGKNNYTALSKDTNIDYVTNPDLLLTEADAMISAIWFWNKNRLNKYADKDDIRTITKRINGGYNGLADRERLLKKWKKDLGI